MIVALRVLSPRGKAGKAAAEVASVVDFTGGGGGGIKATLKSVKILE